MKLEDEATPALLPRDVLWDSFVHVLTHLLVEGYIESSRQSRAHLPLPPTLLIASLLHPSLYHRFAAAKKCSAGGRALMQLDFAHFWSLLEIVSGGKHTEHRAYVEQYVKAYYLPKDLLEQWLLEAHGYSPRQLSGLIACACSSDKKTRQRLLALIEGQTNGSNGGTSSPSPA